MVKSFRYEEFPRIRITEGVLYTKGSCSECTYKQRRENRIAKSEGTYMPKPRGRGANKAQPKINPKYLVRGNISMGNKCYMVSNNA